MTAPFCRNAGVLLWPHDGGPQWLISIRVEHMRAGRKKNTAAYMAVSNAQPSGDWLSDCSTGRAYARAFLAEVRNPSRPLLNWIVRDMIQRGRYSGIEAGFFAAIQESLDGLPSSSPETSSGITTPTKTKFASSRRYDSFTPGRFVVASEGGKN